MKSTKENKSFSNSNTPFFGRGDAGTFSGTKPFFSPKTIQQKLTIGQPNDKYEQEADAMADKVMRMPQNGPALQTKCAGCEQEENVQPKRKGNFLSLKRIIQKMSGKEEETLQTKPLMMKSEGDGGVATSSLTSQLSSTKGNGSPLSVSTNNFMSNAIGSDFSNVRVHTGSKAVQMNQGLNARAFTHGSDVYFNKGEYSPNSSEGKRLLGHELTHVVQQGGREKIQCRRRPNLRAPRLCLFQADDAETPEHAATHPEDPHRDASSYFETLATRKARQLRAVQIDPSGDCPDNLQVGATPYSSGADIIAAIGKVVACTNQPLQHLHIFSHGFTGGHGIVASHMHRRGLVTNNFRTPLTLDQRNEGARTVNDIDAAPFANNAQVVLHGCSIAHGDTSFAEQMLRQLVGTRPNVRVYAHRQAGDGGNTDRRDWSLFTRQNPDGRRAGRGPNR